MACSWACLDQADAPPCIEIQPQLEEFLQDLLGAVVALDEAVLVKEHHVACGTSAFPLTTEHRTHAVPEPTSTGIPSTVPICASVCLPHCMFKHQSHLGDVSTFAWTRVCSKAHCVHA